jgi:thiol-disulfide isomerase/thioredoxin
VGDTSPPPADGSPPPTPLPPRYRGVSGALAYALLIVGLGALLTLFAGVVIWLATGSTAAALRTAARAALFCGMAAVSAGLARAICRGEAERLITKRLIRGDVAAILGILGALLLAGYLTDHLPPPSGPPAEVDGPTVDGGRFDVTKHRGQVVLVDFWATWCGPCKAELPNLRALRKKYRDDGLRLVSVSLDERRDDLILYLKKDPLPWPQIFFDEPAKRGWDKNPLARKYGVKAIPFVLVVDREGNVVASGIGIGGPALEKTVARALGKPASEGEVNPLRWWFVGLFESPWWLMLACGLGAVLLFALIEAGLRFAFRRKESAAA